MAEEEMLSNIGSIAGDAASGIGQGLFWIFILGIAGGVAWVIWWILSHKHKVVLRTITKRGKFIVEEKARPIKKHNGNYWHLLRLRKQVPAPPPEAVEVTKNGRYFVEAYYQEDDGTLTWIEDTNDKEKPLTAFTTQQRALLVSETQEAIRRGNRGWLETLAAVAVPFSMVMIIALVFVFWQDIASPAQKMAETAGKMQEKNGEYLNQLTEISRQNARLMSEMTSQDLVLINRSQVVTAGAVP